MSDESQIDEQIYEGRKRGNRTSSASVSGHDPRVSRGIAWLMGLFGIALVAIGGWIGNTLMGLKDSVTTIVAQNAALIQRLDRNDVRDDGQDSRLSKNERDIAVIEGKTLRGIQEGRTRGN